MIDAYLKTSMPIYDSLDRQNHRDECCKNEQFKLYTDRNHLPPFQLYIPDDVINDASIQWYDKDDNLIWPSPAQLDLDFYSDGTNTWITYDGSGFADTVPVGQYYLIIRPLGEELFVNGKFSTWAGGNPTGWTTTETPPNNEITEVDPSVGHGGGGNGACNWFSDNTQAVHIAQDVMTLNHLYEFNGNVTNTVLNIIQTRFGLGGTVFNMADGANTFLNLCDGADGRLIVTRGVATDVTADNFSLKEVDTSKTYYSELFTVCDCEPILADCDREILTVYDTDEKGSPDEIIKPHGAFGPMVYYYNNKSYGCWQQRGGVGYSVESMVYAIYHESCFISESYGVGPGTLNATDDHAVPVIIVADDKHIVVAHERLTGVGDPDHNGYMQIKRSDNEEDETSWVNAIAHNAGYFDEKGDQGLNRLSYPSLDKLANGKLFLFCRHSSIGELDRVSVHRSNDHGVSWNDLGGNIDGGCDVVDLSPTATGSDLIYKGLCKHPYDNSLHLVVYWKDAPNNNYPDLYYLKSLDDGVNWQSVDGAHSQDITAGGNNPIMKATLDNPANHYRVKNVTNPQRIVPRDHFISDSGIPYISADKGTAGAYNSFIYYWDGAAWSENDIGFPVSVEPTFLIFQRGNEVEIIYPDALNGSFKRNVYRSPNLTTLDTWTLIKEIYEDITDSTVKNRITSTFNYTVTDCEVFASMTNRNVGAYSDFYLFFDCADAFTMCNHLSLTWWHECDFDGIIYQFGYRNRLILDAVLESPRVEIEKSTKKRIGTLFSEWISHKEFYGIKLMLSKYAFYALSRLPLYADNEYGHVILTLPNGDWAEIYEMTIDATWQTDNCYAEFMLDFIQDELVITNCCEDYDVSEQVSE